jgi:hypothetical protein
METLRIKAGRGLLGQYSLDSLVNDVLRDLQGDSTQLPCIKLVDDTKSKRIYIQVASVCLIFDSFSQRLKVIELDLNPVTRYKAEYEGNGYADYEELCSSLHGTCKQVELTETCQVYTYDGLSVVVNAGKLTKLSSTQETRCQRYGAQWESLREA